MSCFMTGSPGKEHRTNKPPPTRRVQERPKWDTTCLTTSQNPRWLNKACTTRKDTGSEWLAKDNLDTNPITIKPKTEPCGRAVFLVPLPYCSLPGQLFPLKSLALSAHISSDNSFPSVRQEPSFGPWKGSLFLQQNDIFIWEYKKSFIINWSPV